MGRSQETFGKKEVRNRKEKKRKEKAEKRQARKDNADKKSSLDDMIAYVDENGQITDTPPDLNDRTEIELEDIAISTAKDDGSRKFDPERRGIVLFFNDSKGYGFIKDKDSQEKIFVHINNVVDEIKEGNVVSFEMGNGPKGPTAVNVKVVK